MKFEIADSVMPLKEAKEKIKKSLNLKECKMVNFKKGKKFTASSGRPGQYYLFELKCKI